MLVTMQDAIRYFNNWESCYQIDVDNFFDTKANTDMEAPPHILNSGRVSPGYYSKASLKLFLSISQCFSLQYFVCVNSDRRNTTTR